MLARTLGRQGNGHVYGLTPPCAVTACLRDHQVLTVPLDGSQPEGVRVACARRTFADEGGSRPEPAARGRGHAQGNAMTLAAWEALTYEDGVGYRHG
jgi:hypothetical protein